ncbi:MAG: peptidoglycan DD-metalloendopeptidase family protein [Arenicella sp.]|nr:peptidoglycan DD-metalloendopeptidase family protein [Arenicella sp.]
MFSYPGGLAQFTLTKNSPDIPEVKFGTNEPVVIEYADYWRILVGLSLETLPGEYVVYIKSGVDGSTVQYQKIVVKQNNYPFREYSERNGIIDRHVVFEAADSFSDIDFSNTQQPTLPLQWPLDGKWSNNFGHKLYDTKLGALYTPNAVVISATELSTVVSPQTALVSKIETSASGISTVYLDHGRGLYSILSGLSDITVKVGSGIVSGTAIGKLIATDEGALDQSVSAGKTLVWQTVMNNAYIDPQVLTQLEP